MNIKNYKKIKNSCYEVTIDDEKYKLYDDIIIKYQLLLKKDISYELLQKILTDNSRYEIYYKSLKFIKVRLRSKKEIEMYLKDYSDELKSFVINKLQDNGYINDLLFANAFVHDKINFSNYGPLKIKNSLIELGIGDDYIDKVLLLFDDNLIKDKIKKYIDKAKKVNKKSIYIFKNKTLNNLIILGYDKKDIMKYLSTDNMDEKDLYNMEYKKVYNSLSKKYSGQELEFRIKQKMYQKGYFK